MLLSGLMAKLALGRDLNSFLETFLSVFGDLAGRRTKTGPSLGQNAERGSISVRGWSDPEAKLFPFRPFGADPGGPW